MNIHDNPIEHTADRHLKDNEIADMHLGDKENVSDSPENDSLELMELPQIDEMSSENIDICENDIPTHPQNDENKIKSSTTKIVPINDPEIPLEQHIDIQRKIQNNNVIPQKQLTIKNIHKQPLPILQQNVERTKPCIKNINDIHNIPQNILAKKLRFDENAIIQKNSKRNEPKIQFQNPARMVELSQSLFEHINISKSTIIFLIMMILIGVGVSLYGKYAKHLDL